jgi:UDP-2,3-diacylglucosamine hydrolase
LTTPANTLFVSDLHLDPGSPGASTQFAEFLLRIARAADALYILGDLFEAWIGDDDDEPYLQEVCAALSRLSGAGVACYVMHGNRDFLLGSGFQARTGCRLLEDPVIVDLYGERVLLTHGDLLCVGDSAYQRLRGVVRHRRWQRRFLRLPLAVRRTLAREARAGSSQHTRTTAAYIMDADDNAVRSVMRACGVHTLIHGHTHRPGVHAFDLDGVPARRIVLGAWYEQGSYLSWHPTDGPTLRTLPRPADQPPPVTQPLSVTQEVPSGSAAADRPS